MSSYKTLYGLFGNNDINYVSSDSKRSHLISSGGSSFSSGFIYGDKFDILTFFTNYTKGANFRDIFFRGLKGILLIFDKSNLNSLEELNQIIEIHVESTNLIPVIVILGLSLINNDKKNKKAELTQQSISDYIEELGKKYKMYIPYIDYIQEKENQFDYSIPYNAFETLVKLIYFKWLKEIDIHKDFKFEIYDFLFNLPQNIEKYNKSQLVTQLKGYIETSNDEFIELKSLKELRKLYDNEDYFDAITKRNNLFRSTLIFAKLLFHEDNNEIINIVNNEKFSTFFKELVIELVEDPMILEKICFDHKNENLKESTLYRLISLEVGSRDEFFNKIVWKSDNSKMQEIAVTQIFKEDELCKIILEHQNDRVTENAFDNLLLLGTDISEEFFKEVIWKTERSSKLRENALKQIIDENELRKIIIEYPFDNIKCNAIRMLKEPISPEIKNLIFDSNYSISVQENIIARIKDYQELESIIFESKEESIQVSAMEKIKKPKKELIEKIVFNKYPKRLQRVAIERCHDQQLLDKILTTHHDIKLRITTLKNLKDVSQKILYDLIQETDNREYRSDIYQYIKIDDNLPSEFLGNIIKNEDDDYNIELLINKCESKKLLGILRLSLPARFQSLIKNRFEELN